LTGRRKYEALLRRFNVPIEEFDRLDPWLADNALRSIVFAASNVESGPGVEAVLRNAARRDEKIVTALETYESQMIDSDSVPVAEQLRVLEHSIVTVESLPISFVRVAELWRGGDVRAVRSWAVFGYANRPVVVKALLYDRNSNWAKDLASRLKKPGTLFVAVGAAHMAGESSLVAALARQGLIVTRIQ
jgi:uncharacterized protein